MDEGGAEGDEEDGRHHEEEDGENEFDAEFAGGFLSGEAAAGADEPGVGAQGGAKAGAEAVGVSEHHGEFFEFAGVGAAAEFEEDFGAGASGPEFELDLLEFGAEVGVEVADLAAGFNEGAVEGLPGFDAEQEQVEGGGQGEVDAFGALADAVFEDALGEKEPEAAGADGGENGELEVFPDDEGGPAGDDGEEGGGGGLDAVEEADGVGSAVAGGDELFAQGADVFLGRRGDFAEEEHRAEERAPTLLGGGGLGRLGGDAPAECKQHGAHTGHDEEEEGDGEGNFAHGA